MKSISDYDVKSTIVNSVREVFDLMLSMEIDYIEAVSQSYLYGRRILASINLVGPVTGMVTIQVNDEFSRIMAGAMLDISPEEIKNPDEVKDVMTEVCNMIAGNLKSGLCDAGLSCDLSVPTLTTGKDYQIRTLRADRRDFFTFFRNTDTVLIEVALKAGSNDQTVELPVEEVPLTQPDTELSRFDIGASISGAVAEVFDMMLDIEILACDLPVSGNTGNNRMVSSVSLSGDLLGWINIQLSNRFAQQIAAVMLDMEPGDFDTLDEVKDVIGEVCNMVSGNLKSAICDAGFACVISPPSFTEGSDFEIECLHLDREEKHAFHHGSETFIVEVGLKASVESLPHP